MEASPAGSGGSNKARRSPVKVALAVCGLLFLSCAICGVGGWFVYLRPLRSAPLTSEQSAAMLRFEDLQELYEFEADPGATIHTSSETFLDGSREMRYEYDSDELYIEFETVTDRRSSDAAVGYAIEIATMPMTMASDEVKVHDRPDMLQWGDQSRGWEFEYNGHRTGLMAVALRGKTVIRAIVSGVEPVPELVERVRSKFEAAHALASR